MRRSLITAALLLAGGATVVRGEETVIRGRFRDTGKGLEFHGDGWSLRSEGDRGWVSFKIGDAEFLDSMAMQKGEPLDTHFPDRSNLSHDQSVGRIGYVADGINMIKFSPNRLKPEVELYVGANEKEDQRLLMFLADEVTAEPGETGLVLKHRRGPQLIVKESVAVEKINGRSAVVFPCKGFAANTYHFTIVAPPHPNPLPRRGEGTASPPEGEAGDAAARRLAQAATGEGVGDSGRLAAAQVASARFDVISSADPEKGNLFGGATHGACNPIYGPDTRLDFGMLFKSGGEKPFNGYAELEIIHSLGQPHVYQKVELKNVAGPEIRVPFQPKFHLPGVSEVWCRLVGADGWLIWTDRYRMAWDWEHYRPKIQIEPDFQQFWDQTLTELRATPLEPETKRVFEDHPAFEIYDVTFNSWAKQRIHAMLFVPREGERPLPAIVSAHPGTTGFGVSKRPDGTYGSELRQDPRFVTIVPLIRGHAPDAKDIPFNHPWWGPLDNRDTYAARAWYCAMVRSIDYLATRPELVDMKRIVARGGSQGGALALVTAALDSRVAVCLSDCPANCQPQEIMEHYPSFGPSKGQVPPGQTLGDVEKMLSYYNPVNFCPWIRCPTYVGSNIGDLTVHSMGPLAAYHNLTGLKSDQKAFYPGFTHAHGSGPGLGVKTQEWLDRLGGIKK